MKDVDLKESATGPKQQTVLSGEDLFGDLRGSRGAGALRKYQEVAVGRDGLLALLRYELVAVALSIVPGVPGLALRKLLYPGLFHQSGSGVVWGRNTTLRHPGKMAIGSRVMVDDGCLFDARGCDAGDFVIGGDSVISRNVVLSSKGGPLRIGSRTTLGVNCSFYSLGGLEVGDDVLVAAHCYVGGGVYHTDDISRPMSQQKAEVKGVKIGNDCWLGAGVVITDGVTVGDHSVVGAGSVVTRDIPPYSIALGSPARVIRDRREVAPAEAPSASRSAKS